MNPIEIEGRSVSEAVETGLKQSGLRRDQAEILVLDEGTPGFLGLGAKLARIRISEKRWGPATSSSTGDQIPKSNTAPRKSQANARRSSNPTTRKHVATRPTVEKLPPAPQPQAVTPNKVTNRTQTRPLTAQEMTQACEKAQSIVNQLLSLMKIAAPTLSTNWDKSMERVKIVVESQDAPHLVGRDGRVLESVQFLSTLMLSRGAEVPVAVQVDALSYWEKKEQAILEEAYRAVEIVRATGKPVRLEPMDASMRRLIHRTLSTHPDVATVSEGEGNWRKIVVRTKKV